MHVHASYIYIYVYIYREREGGSGRGEKQKERDYFKELAHVIVVSSLQGRPEAGNSGEIDVAV